MASTASNSSAPAADTEAARADIVVGLTSYNDAGTIGSIVGAVQTALIQYRPSSTARIVLADAGSSDGTREAARDAVGSPALVEVESERGTGLGELVYHGLPGRAGLVRAILHASQNLGANACAVVDAGHPGVEPDWIQRLIGPVVADGFDYVSPYYIRHVNEGAMTRGIVYPMVRALFGARLRQPMAAEFGCSGRLVTHYLQQEFWDAEHVSAGIDLWLAMDAICGQFRTCEAVLGVRGTASRGASTDMSTTLAQVVGALFAEVEHRVEVWQRIRGSESVPVFGAVPAIDLQGPALHVEALLESFRLGYRELREIWTWILPPRTIVELRRLTQLAPDRFVFDDRLWASIVYDFALGYSFRVMPRDHLLRSLTPLYAGWLSSFALQMHDASLARIDERVEQICLGFEAEKRYLISRWRWPERLR